MAFMAKQRARRHYNSGTRIVMNAGQWLFVDKWHEQAFKRSWKLSSSIPKDAEEGVKHLQKQIRNLGEAVKHLRKAVELDPGFAYAFHNLAHAWYNIAEYNVGVAQLQGCWINGVEMVAPGMWYLSHQADSPQGSLLNEQRGEDSITGALGFALEAVDRALALRYEFPQAHNTRATVLARLGRLDEAMEATEVALLQNPGYTKAIDNMEKVKRLRIYADMRAWRKEKTNGQPREDEAT